MANRDITVHSTIRNGRVTVAKGVGAPATYEGNSNSVVDSGNAVLNHLAARFTSGPWNETSSIAATAADVAAPSSANQAASVVYAAEPSTCHVIDGVCFSYDIDTTAGLLTITTEDGDVIHSENVVVKGPFIHVFEKPKRGPRGKAITVALSAQTGAKGKISVSHRTE